MITYKTGSLFEAPKASLLAHACNCKGKWTSGIAAAFKAKFPESFRIYRDYCFTLPEHLLIGKAMMTFENGYFIGCLFTSIDESHNPDPAEKILEQTRTALIYLDAANFGGAEIHMPKINAGHFKVPWEQTEKVLESLSAGRDRYTIWTPEGT